MAHVAAAAHAAAHMQPGRRPSSSCPADSRAKEIEGMMAIVAKGDAMDPASVQKVFDSE
jgi:hypothetical protein